MGRSLENDILALQFLDGAWNVSDPDADSVCNPLLRDPKRYLNFILQIVKTAQMKKNSLIYSQLNDPVLLEPFSINNSQGKHLNTPRVRPTAPEWEGHTLYDPFTILLTRLY